MNAIALPQFNSVARRKVGALLSDGYKVVGVVVSRGSRTALGAITALGRVEWLSDDPRVTDIDLSVIPTELLQAEIARRST